MHTGIASTGSTAERRIGGASDVLRASALLDHEHDPPVRRSLAGGSPFAWNRSSGYRQTLLQAPGSTPFPSSFAASVQESLLTASMQSLAAPLSNLVPAGHVTWAQPMAFWSSVAQEPLAPGAPQDCALLQNAEANELQAAAGLPVSGPPHAATRAAMTTSEDVNRRSTFETSSLGMSEGVLSSSRAARKCREPRAEHGPSPLRRMQRCDERATAGAMAAHDA